MYHYVLITPARDEEANIEKTLKSVVSQTVLPKKWVIVSDGSTDGTDDIVKEYLPANGWIELVRMPNRSDRQFARKAQCVNSGFQRVKELGFSIIGNLDADISCERDHFEFLIQKFMEDSRLGVAGTPFVENGKHYDFRFASIEHVSGACQLFRRECFEEIGGYLPMKDGGIDWVAVTTARMKGWRTRTFTEKLCIHHRRMGTGNSGVWASWMKRGRKDYLLGGHPLWEIIRGLYRMGERPYGISGFLLILGYLWAALRREERPVSRELVAYHRSEQMERLKGFLGRWWKP
jgi:glycosyltransferase involved in cell wall biosynthesis